MPYGFTYPRTSNPEDAERPVTRFKAELAKEIRRMADGEESRTKNARLKRAALRGQITAKAYRTIAEMCDNIIIEGE
jgi:hypothetical protein